MPPKPRPRKPSTASKEPATKAGKEAKESAAKAAKDATMLPPPDPLPPAGILEPEVNALSGCLKNAVVKTAQIYGFYADTRKLGIQRYAPTPPRSLTASLGREVEKYDQLCDAIESHILRAISVLQRDVTREQRRLKEAEAAAVATRTRSKSTSRSPTTSRIPLPPVPEFPHPDGVEHVNASLAESTGAQPLARTQTSPPVSESGGIRSRRQSAISLSSLHRPSAPHKLDLSSTSLRITAEEASLFNSGLASPVTLAPKSARPTTGNELPDLMAAFASSQDAASRPVDIDLTAPDTQPNPSSTMNIDMDLGNSAEKPIELDLEGMDIDMSNMSDLFGDADTSSTDANAAVDGLFSPSTTSPNLTLPDSSTADKSVKQENLDMEILDAFADNHDLFASLEPPSQNISISNPTQSPSLSVPSTTGPASIVTAPSPGSILASFASDSQMNVPDQSSSSNNNGLSSGEPAFDLSSIDLDNLSPGFFNTQTPGMNLMEMEELLNMGGDLHSGNVEGSKSG